MNILSSRLSFLAAAALPIALVASACSSKTASSDSCSSYFDSLVAYANRCAAGQVAPGSVEAGRARFVTYCGNLRGAPGESNAESAIDACTTAYNASDCSAEVKCAEHLSGALAENAACGDSSQCTSGHCKKASSTTQSTPLCGTCAPAVAVGSACTDSSECGAGSTCDTIGGTGTGTCKAVAAVNVGDVCFDPVSATTSGTCPSGSTCRPPVASTTPNEPYKCTAPGATGATCESDFDCSSQLACANKVCGALPAAGAACTGRCAAGLTCDLAAKTCAAITFVNVGDECSSLKRCTTGSCEGNTFSAGTDGKPVEVPGKCAAPIADGAPCGTDIPGNCDTFAECLDGKCQIPNPALCK